MERLRKLNCKAYDGACAEAHAIIRCFFNAKYYSGSFWTAGQRKTGRSISSSINSSEEMATLPLMWESCPLAPAGSAFMHTQQVDGMSNILHVRQVLAWQASDGVVPFEAGQVSFEEPATSS